MKKTLLFGNGFNRLNIDDSKYSWETLLETLAQHKTLNLNTIKNLPNTMIYESILLHKKNNIESLEYGEEAIKQIIANIMKQIPTNKFYEDALIKKFDNYITTNYDHALIDSLLTLYKDQENTEQNQSEKIYSIRRFYEFNIQNNKKTKLWHMHGNIKNPKSIQLGLDHYAGAIGKIDAYIKGNYEYTSNGENIKIPTIQNKLSAEKDPQNENHEISWIDLFFNSNIHIIGLGLDYSEYDLWWILNKRARFMSLEPTLIKNKITFYCAGIDESKKELLESFNVIVHIVDIQLEKSDPKYYQRYTTIALDAAYQS